jgi:lipopolysaccharide export system protein LptA
MPLNTSHLRRWLVAAGLVLAAIVAGFYVYASHRAARAAQRAVKQVPQKLGLEIQQSAQGFSISKSEEGRTLFTARASKVVQFRADGRAELHDVAITFYGRDSSRFDQISGADFAYDRRSGNITASGPVEIDLEANPTGISTPDQVPPKELKNPVHIRTSGLVFNEKSGNAFTHDKVEFSIATASGWAHGARYDAHSRQLVLENEVRVTTLGEEAASLTASRGIVLHDPPRVILSTVHMVRGGQVLDADQATVFLSRKSEIERALAEGNVRVAGKGVNQLGLRAARAEVFVTGPRALLRQAVFSGDVQAESSGVQNMSGSAGRIVLDFTGKDLLAKARAEENVHFVQKPAAGAPANAQQVAIASSAVDFAIENGRHLVRAETAAQGEITLSPATASGAGSTTRVTAGKFTAQFDDHNRLQALHGEPDASIVSSTAGQPDRVSTSQTLDVTFHPQGGMEKLLQDGAVHYRDGAREAWADHGRYTPADSMLELRGHPRIQQEGITTTADVLRFNRSSGEAWADGNVKSTYSQLKAQPDGALLASSDPIHVTARSMHARRDSSTATYTGNARLWQGANAVQAPTLSFDRDRRYVSADGSGEILISTFLVATASSGKTTPITLTSQRLTYTDAERRVHFAGGVSMKTAEATVTSDQLDTYLAPSGQTRTAGPGRLEKATAQGHVIVQQPGRQATGDLLTYTASEDKFVMTGGPPSIFDAERGKVTGVSLTFYRLGGTVQVEGTEASPTVTRIRVAR